MEQLAWKTEQRKVNDLLPYEFNPRLLTEEQAEQLQTSLKKFNLVEIPVINSDNTIIAGHQRCKILQLLGRGNESIEVRVPNRKLTDEEVKEYNIRSNKNHGMWDWEMLGNNFELEKLIEIGFSNSELHFEPSKTDLGSRETDQSTLSQDMETFNEGAIKQIVLFYKSEEYESVIDKLQFLMKKQEIGSFTEVINQLINKKVEEYGDYTPQT